MYRECYDNTYFAWSFLFSWIKFIVSLSINWFAVLKDYKRLQAKLATDFLEKTTWQEANKWIDQNKKMNCKKHREITHFGQEIESKSKLCNENNPTVKKLSFMRACVLNYIKLEFLQKSNLRITSLCLECYYTRNFWLAYHTNYCSPTFTIDNEFNIRSKKHGRDRFRPGHI